MHLSGGLTMTDGGHATRRCDRKTRPDSSLPAMHVVLFATSSGTTENCDRNNHERIMVTRQNTHRVLASRFCRAQRCFANHPGYPLLIELE